MLNDKWFKTLYCGEEGIRTPGTVPHSTHAFQACTFDHSVTSPFEHYFKEFQWHKIQKKNIKKNTTLIYFSTN